MGIGAPTLYVNLFFTKKISSKLRKKPKNEKRNEIKNTLLKEKVTVSMYLRLVPLISELIVLLPKILMFLLEMHNFRILDAYDKSCWFYERAKLSYFTLKNG